MIRSSGSKNLITYSVIDTPHGQTYLRKLCRHFARQVPATLTESRGRIEFSFGPCWIEVDTGKMSLSIELHDERQVGEAERVLEEHLLKLADQEQPKIKWYRKSSGFQNQQTL